MLIAALTAGDSEKALENKDDPELQAALDLITRRLGSQGRAYTKHTTTTVCASAFHMACDKESPFSIVCDSGSSRHAVNKLDYLVEGSVQRTAVNVLMGDGKKVKVTQQGSVVLSVARERGAIRPRVVTLKDVLFIPECPTNLVSVAAMDQEGYSLTFAKGELTVRDPYQDVAFTGKRSADGLYQLRMEIANGSGEEQVLLAGADKDKNTEDLEARTIEAHCKWGHRDMRVCNKMEGLPPPPANMPPCVTCQLAHMQSASVPKKATKPMENPLDRLCGDIAGQDDDLYLCVLDEGSRKSWVLDIPSKDKAVDEWLALIERVEREKYPKKVGALRSDGESVFVGTRLQSELKKRGIRYQSSARYKHSQNGLVENRIKQIGREYRAIMKHAAMGRQDRHYARAWVNQLINRFPTTGKEGRTPNKIWESDEWDKETYPVRGIFGCFAMAKDYVYKKDGDRARPGVYLGRDDQHKCEIIRDLRTGKILYAYDVKFWNKTFPYRKVRPRPELAAIADLHMDYKEPAGEGESSASPYYGPWPIDELAEDRNEGEDVAHNIECGIDDEGRDAINSDSGIDDDGLGEEDYSEESGEELDEQIEEHERKHDSESDADGETEGRRARHEVAPPVTRRSSRLAKTDRCVRAVDGSGPGFIPQSINELPDVDQEPDNASDRDELQDNEMGAAMLMAVHEVSAEELAKDIAMYCKKQGATTIPQQQKAKREFFERTVPAATKILMAGGGNYSTGRAAKRRQREEKANVKAAILMVRARAEAERIAAKATNRSKSSKGKKPMSYKESRELELAQIKGKDVYEIINEEDVPAGNPIIGGRWVECIKYNPDGSVDKYKSRVVAKGFKWIMNYGPTFSTMARDESVKFAHSISADKGLHQHKIDMTVFFLHGELDEPIYMRPPEGCGTEPGQLWKLSKSIYGLPNAGRLSKEKLDSVLRDFGLTQAKSDDCVFFKLNEKNQICYLIVQHVDDLLICTRTQNEYNKLAAHLGLTYDLKEFEADIYLGVQIEHDRENNKIKIHQEHTARKILKEFGMENCNPTNLPAEPNHVMEPAQEGEEVNNPRYPYRQLVGYLVWMLKTRIDLRWAVSQVCRFVNSYTTRHWKAAKRILRYIAGTLDRGLVYSAGDNPRLEVYVDAGWNTIPENSKSPYGFFIKYGKYGVITSEAKTTGLICHSTCEAEHYAATEAGKALEWLRGLCEELGMPQEATPVYEDNQGAISLAKDMTGHARTKHFRIRQHYLRQLTRDRVIDVRHVSSKRQLADVLTKGLPKPQFNYTTQEIMGDHVW